MDEDRRTLVEAGDRAHQHPDLTHTLLDYSPAESGTVDAEAPCAVPAPAPWALAAA